VDKKYPKNEFREFVERTLKLWHVPGVAVAVIKNGEVILCEGFGLRNVAKNLPVTSDTVFPIASCTKAFTAMCVGLLVDEGKLNWDKPVRDYMPDFKLKDTFATEHMTPRDLLTHRSGLPRHDLMWYASNFSRSEVFDRLQYLEPNRDFRYTFQYSNIMYMVAGLLVGKIAGTSWERFVQTRIFDWLGMDYSTLSTVVTQQSHDFATPYLYRDKHVKEIPFFEADGEKDAIGPAGNINSCVSDMAKWLRVHLNRGKIGEEQFISEGNLEQMHTPHIFVDDPQARNRFGYEFTSYGLGWGMRSHKGQVLVQHGGAMDGFASFASLMPAHNVGIVVLSNADAHYNPIPNIVAYTIYDRLVDLKPTDWNALFKPLYNELVGGEEHSKEKSSTERKADAEPSHPVESYLGDYEHPGYGVISIRKEKTQLKMVMNDKLILPLKHYHYDIFEANIEKWDYRLKLSFSTDLKGNIAQIAVQMEPLAKDVVFLRKPDVQLTEKSFLSKFVGIYDFQKTLLTIALKGGNILTATIQGEPEHVLAPYQGTEFHFQGLSGYGIEFKQDSAGKFVEAIVTQPGMVLTARRRGQINGKD
jgi:CubicO group peptidase (beta-lactamase class C family)